MPYLEKHTTGSVRAVIFMGSLPRVDVSRKQASNYSKAGPGNRKVPPKSATRLISRCKLLSPKKTKFPPNENESFDFN